MVWGLADRFVDEVIEIYLTREHAERALRAVLADEPEWEGMLEVVPIGPGCRDWGPRGKRRRGPCSRGHRAPFPPADGLP
jgi:hypothetical protein